MTEPDRRYWWHLNYRHTNGTIDWQPVEVLDWAEPTVVALPTLHDCNGTLPPGKPVRVRLEDLYDQTARDALDPAHVS
jgi:hypothetical protein